MTSTDQATTEHPTGITTGEALTGERRDLLDTLAKHRYLFRTTVAGLTDEQAGARTTVSALCLGGLIKHVAAVERGWLEFALRGQAAMPAAEDVDYAAREAEFRLLPGETLAGVLADYDEVAARTSEIIAMVPDLDASHPLPAAPWFEPGASWSIRRVLLHVIAETAQHAGHADILREAIDGARTMG